MSSVTMSNTRRLVTIAFFIALEVVLTRFLSINTDFLRIGFGFLPVACVGILFGPLWAGAAYAIGDMLGMMIFPSGSYFPGFTVSAFVIGCIYGIFLYKKDSSIRRIIIPVVLVCLGVNLFVDTLWLNILYGQAYLALLPMRLIKCAVMVPIQVVLIKLVWDKVLKPFMKKT